MNVHMDLSARLGALEFTATAVAQNDGVLEQTGASAQPQTIAQPWCHHIGDGALEQAALQMQPKPQTMILPGMRKCV